MPVPAARLIPVTDSDAPADLAVRNGRVFTGDPRRPAVDQLIHLGILP